MTKSTLCKHCRMDVHPSLSHCPVCGRFMHHVDATTRQQLYPNPNYKILEKRNTKVLETIFAFPLLTTLITTLFIDFFLIQNNFGPSFLVTISVFYAWILIYKTILSRNRFGDKLLWQVFGLSGLLLFIALTTEGTFNSWAIQYVIPILLSVANVLMLIVVTVQRKTDTILIQTLSLSVISSIPFILFFLRLNDERIPAFLAFLFGMVNLLALFTYLRKKFIAFIQRWLHI